jgi:outer membrane murein-binding lipoprotein Lpp
MYEEALLIGYAVLAIITLGSFVGLVLKFTQPINELRVVIQKLNDNIDTLKSDNTTHSKRLDKHGEQIDKLDNRVGKLETKMNIYHKEQS